MADCNETWMPVVGYEGIYEVSNRGSVRSVERQVRQRNRWGYCTRTFPGVVIVQEVSKAGYLRVNLASEGRASHRSVHSLVAESFIGPRPEGLHVCHNDGVKTNNVVENLRYDTASANVLDCVRHGSQAQARKTHCPQGHPYDESNTTWIKTKSGRGRHCRTCKRERERARRRAARVIPAGPTVALEY